MPNLTQPVARIDQVVEYRNRILDALDEGVSFQPLMTLYLTGETTPEQILEAKKSGIVQAIKMYPAGATTNSEAGVSDIWQKEAVFEIMQEIGMTLSIHGEVVDHDIDIFDREKVYIDRVLQKLVKRFPAMRIVLEHLTTNEAVDFVLETPAHISGTITVHHLLYSRNDLLVGGIKPHLYCLPIVKTEKDRTCLVKAATSGNPKFFLGTDSAPHSQVDKEAKAGKAGIYSAPVALPLCAELFEKEDRLDYLEAFCSFHGADFYCLPRNSQFITLKKEKMTIPESYPFGKQRIIPLKAGETISWKLDGE